MYILILFVSIGMMSERDSNALLSVEFTDKVSCEAAGKLADSKFSGGTKRVDWFCTQKGK